MKGVYLEKGVVNTIPCIAIKNYPEIVNALNIRAFVQTLAQKVATLKSKNILIRNPSFTLVM